MNPQEQPGGLLQIAARNGCLAVFHLFRDCKGLAKHRDDRGWTVLHEAACSGWIDIVDFLLREMEADIHAKTSRGRTALHIFSGATVNHEAYPAIVSLLIREGADVMEQTWKGRTALHIACLGAHNEAAILLLNEMKSHSKTLQIYLGRSGHDILYAAATRGCISVVQELVILLNEGHSSILSAFVAGKTVTYDTIAANHADVALVLLRNDALARGSDGKGNTSMHWAATHGHTSVAAYLLANDPAAQQDIHSKNTNGMRPLDCAATSLHGELLGQLLQYEHSPRPIADAGNTDGWTVLHWAVWYERLDLVRMIMNLGVDIRVKDSRGRIAL
jgi:ankyrin repeat protein